MTSILPPSTAVSDSASFSGSDSDSGHSEAAPSTYGSPAAAHLALPTPDAAGDPSEIAKSAYARRRQELLKLLGDLHGTGVQKDLPLPQIAVLGSQSVGKSSLIESISGVRLPRDTGTCTRCPMECRLTNAPGPWRCRVSLRFQVDDDGKDLVEAREVPFGKELFAPDDVERRLRQAQRALLRPNLKPETFLDDSDLHHAGGSLSFTANCVCVQISGPDVTDLHFFDLPGIIANVKEGQQRSDIELVKSLAMRYIKKPGCIILLVVSCDTDFENQGAGRLARDIDPRGETTVGVLTKPDRAEHETVDKWQNINTDLPLKSGWFVLKLPNPTELKDGISWEDAKRSASQFFQTNPSWSAYAKMNPRRIGTENLTEYLSQRLSEQLNHELPKLRTAIAELSSGLSKQLDQLPREFAGDPSNEVFSLVQHFSRDVSDCIRGMTRAGEIPDDQEGLIQQLLEAYEKFKCAIRRTTPRFDPRRSPAEQAHPEDQGSDHSDCEELRDVDSDGEEMPVYTDSNPRILARDVMRSAKKARTRELPGNYPFSVKERYINGFLKKWPAPAYECFDSAADIFDDALKQLVKKHFGKYEFGGLLDAALDALQTHLDRVRFDARNKLKAQLDVEMSRLYTQNEHYFFDYRDKMFARYKEARSPREATQMMNRLNAVLGDAVDEDFNRNVNTILAGLAAIGITASAPDLSKLLPGDPMDPALHIMAEVRAYFQVAYKRTIDVVPLTIENELINAADKNMTRAILRGLDFLGDGMQKKCRSWVSEPIAIAQERAELIARRKTLEAARTLLARHVL